MKKTLLALSLLVLGLTLAQPGPGAPTPPGPSPMPGQDGYMYRKAEKASKKLYRLQYELSYSQGPRSALAQRLYQEAQRDYQIQRFFAAKERAKAAREILEAQRLEAGLAPMGSKGWPGKVSYSAFYRAQEKIARVEAELAYYRTNNPLVGQLLEEAKRALAEVNPDDFRALLKGEAARKLADAAHHLIKADRGF